MKPLTKDLYVKSVIAIVAVLFIVRLCIPSLVRTIPSSAEEQTARDTLSVVAKQADTPAVRTTDSLCVVCPASGRSSGFLTMKYPVPHLDFSRQHHIKSVTSYKDAFPDLQEIQFPAAIAGGVRPVENRAEAELRKNELLFVGGNPYYQIDSAMNRSIPYLVPKASHLLQHIGRRFLDSLAVKGIPLHKIIVTSVLRTEDDVRRLRRINGNASEQSCHRFGTTFDISYNRYHTVAPPDDPGRRAVRNDSLKFILSEVLRDVRADGHCYIKYEVKQGCFHITVR